MNHNFKMQLVALLATLTGTTLGTCQAMQLDNHPTTQVEVPIVRPAEIANGGAFGAVKIAKPYGEIKTDGGFPPIVSAADATDSAMVLPPIVKPQKAVDSPVLPQIVQAQPVLPQIVQAQPELPEIVQPQPGFGEYQPDASTAAISAGMLAPLAPILQTAKTADIPTAEMPMPMAFAPAPLIQANSAPSEIQDEATVHQAVEWSQQNSLSQGVSAAGIPLYPKGAVPAGFTAPQDLMPPPIVQQGDGTPPMNVPMIVQGSGSDQTPPFISSESQIVRPMNTLIAAPPTPTNSLAPMPMSSVPIRQSSTSQPRSRPQEFMTPAPTATMDSVLMEPTSMDPSYFSSQPIEAPVISSGAACNGCGGNGCPECGVAGTTLGDVAMCQSCGPGGCFNGPEVERQFTSSGSVSGAERYLTFDAIYLDRNDGTVALSNFGGLNNFEDDLFGAMITFGRRVDCANGDELTYFGSAELSQSAVHTDALGRISAGYPSTGPFASETTAFRNAVEQAQFKETTFHSIEYNRVDWGWDVVKTFWGMRYIYVEDDYQLASRNLANETGLLELKTFNNLFGLHAGYELFYDVGYRLSWSTVGKFGLYANPNQVNTRLFNAGAQFLDLEDTNTAFSGTIELGLQGHYKFAEQARFRFGYTAFYLDRVAGVSDNVPTAISPTTGSDTSDSGQMFFHGFGFGFEVFR